MQMLGSRQGMGGPSQDDEDGGRRPPPASRAAPVASKPASKPSTGFDDMDDDIPF
jgi:single-strand DNA-binding protein